MKCKGRTARTAASTASTYEYGEGRRSQSAHRTRNNPILKSKITVLTGKPVACGCGLPGASGQ